MDTPEETYYTIQEYAKLLKVSARTIRREIERGNLKCIRIGERTWRIPASSIKAEEQ